MRRWKQLLSAVLACLLLVGMVGCGGKDDPAVESSSETVTAPEGNTDSVSYENLVPKKNYNNETFRVLCTMELEPFFDDEKSYIDKVKQAVLRRNELTCSLYGVDLRYVSMVGNASGADAFAAKVRAICNGGDDSFDLVLPQARYGVPLGLEGLYYNFSESDAIRWDEAWYYHNINDNCTIMEQTYYLASAFLIDKIYSA